MRCPLLRLSAAPGALLLMLGTGILAWDYALRLSSGASYALFWAAAGTSLLGTMLVGTRGIARVGSQLAALAAFGAFLWLPYFLRSPTRLIFEDELFHYGVTQWILQHGHSNAPVTGLYAIPGDFPGIEFVCVAMMGATGLPLDAAVRLVTLSIHVTIPLLAYCMARGFGFPERMSFIAALIYAANSSYFFFHSIFSYETLGILFVLAVWVLLAGCSGRGIGRRTLAAILLLSLGLAVTHHVSSYLLAISVGIGWLIQRVAIRGRIPGLGLVALWTTSVPLLWLIVQTRHASEYLTGVALDRLDAIRATFFERHATRHLLAISHIPRLERVADYLYAPLLAATALLGAYLYFRNRPQRDQAPLLLWSRPRGELSPLLLTLGIFGPVFWLLSVPVVFTASADVTFRSWPFLFIGLIIYCTPAMVYLADRAAGRMRISRHLFLGVMVGLLFVGGISLGDNQAGRFPAARPLFAAGPEDVTADAVAAAQWLYRAAGGYHLIATDFSSATTFTTYGYQRAAGDPAPLFVATDAGAVAWFMRHTRTEYVVADQRVTTLPPRYGTYYGADEIPALERRGLWSPYRFPAVLLRKFDSLPGFNRIYDNGAIVIYHYQR